MLPKVIFIGYLPFLWQASLLFVRWNIHRCDSHPSDAESHDSSLCQFLSYLLWFPGAMGNHALWMAFITYLLLRGVMQGVMGRNILGYKTSKKINIFIFAKTKRQTNMARFKRILLKLSGESLMGEKQYGIDEKRLGEYAQQIKEIHDLGVQIGIVIGGGNIFRGLSGASKGFDRVKGDQMGMLATVINSLGLSSALGAAGVKARVLTAIRMEPIGEFYNKWKAIEAMENGEVVIMSAGTGNPFFTTDTGSSLRGIEIEADVMLKGTRVDGIYTADPEKDPTATKFDDITYDEVLKRGLKVMDLTATCMCKENNLPIIVFDMDTVGNLKKVMTGENIGTLVHN